MGDQPDPEGFAVPATHRRVWDFSRDGVLRSIEASLERLALDRIDLVLIHDPDDHAREALEEAAPALSQLRSEGVIGGYGAGMNQAAMLARFVRETDMDVAWSRAGTPSWTRRRQRISSRRRSSGAWASSTPASSTPACSRAHSRARTHGSTTTPSPPTCSSEQRAWPRVCEEFGVDLPTAALAFAGRHPAVTSVVVGLQTPDQVRELVARWGRTVPDGLWSALSEEGLMVPFVS